MVDICPPPRAAASTNFLACRPAERVVAEEEVSRLSGGLVTVEDLAPNSK